MSEVTCLVFVYLILIPINKGAQVLSLDEVYILFLNFCMAFFKDCKQNSFNIKSKEWKCQQ
jgi:hypothetical protein